MVSVQYCLSHTVQAIFFLNKMIFLNFASMQLQKQQKYNICALAPFQNRKYGI